MSRILVGGLLLASLVLVGCGGATEMTVPPGERAQIKTEPPPEKSAKGKPAFVKPAAVD